MKHRISFASDRLGMTAALGLVLIGCGVDTQPEATAPSPSAILRSTAIAASGEPTGEHKDFKPLASIRLEQESMNFYEVSPGTIITTEQGVGAAELPASDELDAVQRYELLSGEKAPAALVEAVERARQVPAVPRAPVVEVTEPSFLLLNKDKVPQGDHAGFRARFCVDQDREELLLDTTGQKQFLHKDANYIKTGVYATRGAVYFGFWIWDGGGIGSNVEELWPSYPIPEGAFPTLPTGDKDVPYAVAVPQDHYRAYRIDCRNCTAKGIVLGVGQTYDFCTNWHK